MERLGAPLQSTSVDPESLAFRRGSINGVRRIALIGSIVTAKLDPKDIDVLVVVADDADLAALATCARRLHGHAQSFNRGADVFVADERGTYIGRTCRWKDCRPGRRATRFIAVVGHTSTTISMRFA